MNAENLNPLRGRPVGNVFFRICASLRKFQLIKITAVQFCFIHFSCDDIVGYSQFSSHSTRKVELGSDTAGWREEYKAGGD